MSTRITRRALQEAAGASAVHTGRRHPRRGWARPAEDALSEWLGPEWAVAVADRASWQARRDDFVTWCAAEVVLRPPQALRCGAHGLFGLALLHALTCGILR